MTMASESENVPSAAEDALAAASAGLQYTSESDRPFETWALPGGAQPGWPCNASEFAARLGARLGLPDGPAEERSLHDLLRRHIEGIDASDAAAVALRPRFEALRAALTDWLDGLRVFRFGAVEVHCLIVGRPRGEAGGGDLVGLRTVAIET